MEVRGGGVRWWLVSGEGGEVTFGYGGVGRHMEIGEEDAPRGREGGGEC